MNKANECTCPSGEGSLRWPCPAHPAVEQAGGDERAAFDAYRDRRNALLESEGHNPGSKWHVTNAHYPTWEASRASLAQPSPAIATAPTYQFHSREIGESDWAPCDFSRYLYCSKSPEMDTRVVEVTAQPSPAQAEAERPEVVARVDGADEDWFIQPEDETEMHNEGLLFAGCELGRMVDFDRIVGARGAERDGAIKLLGQSVWQKIQLLTQERDAALARVAELERQEPVGSAYGVLPPFAEKVLAKLRRFYVCAEDFESGGVDIGRHWLDLLTQLGLLNRVQRSPAFWEISQQGEDLLEAPVAQAQHSGPEGLAEFSQFLSAVMDAAGLVRYGRRSKELSEYLGAQCMKYRLSAPVAQAQHSGPEEFSFEYRHPNGESHTVTVSRDQVISEMPDFLLEALCSKFCNCEPVGETNVVECCCDEYAEEFKLLAAAPGKEVPQAWLDVQAERRRQVEVEGYHGFRDNHYISYELSKAARAYIEVSWHALSGGLPCKKPESWPWMAGFKWSDGRTMLVKAGALILAEIERLDRAAPGKEVGHE
ncbi:TPA: hypothetical protein NHR75_000194 [Pseudomonas aeruginosa]|nr:hypothetical protein [Pseudomonas aeruginosa]